MLMAMDGLKQIQHSAANHLLSKPGTLGRGYRGRLRVLPPSRDCFMNDLPEVLPNNPAAEYFFQEGCHILELSNDSTDSAVSIARARVAPGVTTRWHRLAGITERYVLLAGQGRVEVGELPPQVVGPGDVVRIPPACRQRITCLGPGELIFLAICSPRFLPEAYEDLEGPQDSGAGV